jgi:hypothetical protein
MNHRHSVIVALVCTLLLPLTAQADMFSMYVSGKGGYVTGSGTAFSELQGPVGAGAEVGLELIGIDIWGEALKVGDNQFYFTANLGFDVTYGDEWRFTVGAYTGPMVFMSPREETRPFALSGTARSALTAQGINPDTVETQYNDVKHMEDELNRYSLGWNLVRGTIQFERRLVPLVYIGVSGFAAYHYLLRGEELAANEKDSRFKKIDATYQLSQTDPGVASQIRNEFGAKELDRSKLGGFNYNVGAYLKIEI